MIAKVLIGAVAVLLLQVVTRTVAASCDAKCTTGPGTCLSSGRCLCFWGWTGPNAKYIMSGSFKNRILADYCLTACHYTQNYLNGNCASIPTPSPVTTPQVCSVPVNKTVPPLPCDSQCGTGNYHGLGRCLSNGRCLCWWGWTGSNACYVNGGSYNSRILADSCTKACHYTHDYRNVNCSSSTPTSKPTTQSPSTGNATTGKPSTGQPTTSSATTTNQTTSKPNPPTKQQTTTLTSAKTTSVATKQTTTNIPATTSKSSSTGKPTTTNPNQPSTATSATTAAGTAKKTTVNVPATTSKSSSTGQPTTMNPNQPSTKQQTTTPPPPAQTTTTTSGTTTSMPPSTWQKTTTGSVTSTTAKAATTLGTTTGMKTTTVAMTTKPKTTTQKLSTTAKPTTTQATTTEPTEPPEPTEPTEPGILIRGMAPHQQNPLLQNDVDVGEVKGEEKNLDKEEKSFSPTGLVIIMVVLLICVLALVVGVWWSYGNGNQFPSLWRGYEPVGDADSNMLMKELSESSPLP